MKLLMLLFFLMAFSPFTSMAQTVFRLKPDQSMLMTGKGPGQDGAINPYAGQDCFAIVENTGELEFSIRVQQQGKIIREIPILEGETKKVKLLKGHELYFDTDDSGKVKVSLDFEKVGE